jgi:hypothetical protein
MHAFYDGCRYVTAHPAVCTLASARAPDETIERKNLLTSLAGFLKRLIPTNELIHDLKPLHFKNSHQD